MDWSEATGSLDIRTLRALYGSGTLTPTQVVEIVYQRIAARGEDEPAWIYLLPREDALRRAAEVERDGDPSNLLHGIPFALKDNIDVPGLPTTSGCPATRYIAESTGPAVQRLFDAGGILIGKTNMDQFAIGLVGVRSPYGICSSVFNEAYISGGSSAGSAVVVAAGLVSFALGNDAAGSGRVPAAFNNIIGLKPTPGLISNSAVSGGGTVKLIETISVLGLTCDDTLAVLKLIGGYDPAYEFSKPEADDVDLTMPASPSAFRFGVPDAKHLTFLGDSEAERLFREGIDRMTSLGGTQVEVDFAPFEEAQRILYDGPWIAERSLTLGPVLENHRDQIHPVTRSILETGRGYAAEDLFGAIHRLAELKCETRPAWDAIDFLLVPTTPTIYTIAEIEADPIQLNALLGSYTNFANLMGLCGIAIPNGFREDGLPQGITLLGQPFREAYLSAVGASYQRAIDLPLGATPNHLPDLGVGP
jgi:allophanate hydrolase